MVAAAVLILAAAASGAEDSSRIGLDPHEQVRRMGRGVNAIGYDPLWRDSSVARFRTEHFRRIREAGFSHVRINLHPFRDARPGPDGAIGDGWWKALDWAVDGALSSGLLVVLDFHEFTAMARDPEGKKPLFLSVWRRIAERCKNRPPEVLFEILNEPNGELTPEKWNDFLREALETVRPSNPGRTVIVGPAQWNGIGALERLRLPPEDRNIIVTVHYYGPFEFTHQGTPWTDRKDKVGVTWNGTAGERAAVAGDFDMAAAWASRESRPLYLGEFGAYEKGDMESRVRWTACIAREAERRGWAWAYWQFDGDFIIYEIPKDRWVEPIRDALIPREGTAAPVGIRIDAGKVNNSMRGGIGASWHAIEEPIPFSDVPDPVFGNKSHGGSGWGGYPPADDDAAWGQIDRHARWLGLDWNRVELEQRIYEPERGKFDWDGREMRILYRILDWCERNGADVFLQQMWGNVRWNAFPEWRDDPVGRVHSGPASMEDFADGLAALVEHLLKRKGYTCIRWLSIVNEPNGGWSWWQAPPNRLLPLRPGLAAVRKALDARGLALPLSGPDMTGGVPPLDPGRFDYGDLLGAWDFHSYDEDFDWRRPGGMALFDGNTAAWAEWAHQQGKPLFMSEFGTMANGWGGDNPGPASWDSVLKDAELVVRRLPAGVDGFNRWSFLNRGDLDGQWQFIETWDRKEKKLLGKFGPRANTYFGLGLLSRFIAKRSEVLGCAVDGGLDGGHPRVFAAALRSPKGQLTVTVVNDAPEPFDLSVEIGGLSGEVRLHRYGLAGAERDRSDLRIDPQAEFRAGPGAPAIRDRIAPMAIAVYSTYRKAHDDDGAMAE